jgi:ABC-type glycerol-3-phosphate transport system permease component
MNLLQILLLALFAAFVVLRLFGRGRTVSRFARWTLLCLGAVVVLAPFTWLLAAVVKDRSVLNEFIFLPPVEQWSEKTLNLNNFRELFKGRPSLTGPVYFWEYVLNSTVYATCTTVLQIFFCSLGGYALAKYEFRGKNALTLFMLGSMMIPSVLLLAPQYKMIIPGMVGTYGIFLFRQACLAVPNEMIDAARLDGCGEFGIYLRLVMPLVRPMAAAFCLICFLGNWNAFFAPNVFLQSQDKLTLPVVLNLYLGEFRHDQGVFLTGTALAMIPPAVLFFALQREFISGLTSGAVKG